MIISVAIPFFTGLNFLEIADIQKKNENVLIEFPYTLHPVSPIRNILCCSGTFITINEFILIGYYQSP